MLSSPFQYLYNCGDHLKPRLIQLLIVGLFIIVIMAQHSADNLPLVTPLIQLTSTKYRLGLSCYFKKDPPPPPLPSRFAINDMAISVDFVLRLNHSTVMHVNECHIVFADEMRREEEEMSDFLCIGDYISLYCEDMEGYIYSWQSR